MTRRTRKLLRDSRLLALAATDNNVNNTGPNNIVTSEPVDMARDGESQYLVASAVKMWKATMSLMSWVRCES